MRSPTTTFGAFLREQRQNQEISLTDFGNRINRSRATASRWEIGEDKPKVDELEQIAAALDIEPGVVIQKYKSNRPIAENRTTDSNDITDLARHAQQARSLNEILDLEAKVARGSSIIVLSMLEARERQVPRIVEVVAPNLLRGVRHIYALPPNGVFKKATKAIAEWFDAKQIEIPEDNPPLYCDLEECLKTIKSANSDLYQSAYKIVNNAAVILDQRSAKEKVQFVPPILGYSYVEYCRGFADDNPDRLFLPMGVDTTRIFSDFIYQGVDLQGAS